MVDEIKLNDFLVDFESKTCVVKEVECNMNYIISADWIELMAELNLTRPNTPDLTLPVLVMWGE